MTLLNFYLSGLLLIIYGPCLNIKSMKAERPCHFCSLVYPQALAAHCLHLEDTEYLNEFICIFAHIFPSDWNTDPI